MGVTGRFPVQAITSTNLNHSTFLRVPNFNFRTKFLEIIVQYPKRVLSSPTHRQERINDISEIIQQNPDKLCLALIHGSKTALDMTLEQNLSFIQFQIDCGFKLIKVFFKDGVNALTNLQEYRSSIPDGRKLVMVLDENLEHVTFRELYLNAIDHGDEIIGFLGREPDRNDDENRQNFQFISSRENDKIIRLVTSISKSFGGIVGSLVYNWFGFDVYTFLPKFGPPNPKASELKALNVFSFQPLRSNSNLTCVVRGTNLYNSSRLSALENRSSVPVSVHDIVRLNMQLEALQDNYTRQLIEIIVRNSVF